MKAAKKKCFFTNILRFMICSNIIQYESLVKLSRILRAVVLKAHKRISFLVYNASAFMLSSFSKLAIWLLTTIVVGSNALLAQSQGGKLTGKVVDKDGNPVAGVTVNVTNQTTTESSSKPSKADGGYSFNLKVGAYRLTVGALYEARFDR